jgi:predicted nucleic acid-binding protein
VILVDTSAWVEYLRGTGSDLNIRVRAYLDNTDALAITEVVAMELLAGVRTDADGRHIETIVNGVHLLRTAGLDDFVYAAELFRTCRRAGDTVRTLDDCLIAAVAIRNDVALLHDDRDFEVLARHTPLQVA